jgi:hypothetical protein
VVGVQLKEGITPSDQLAGEILLETARLLEHERPVRAIFVTELLTVLGGAKVQRQALRGQLAAETG